MTEIPLPNLGPKSRAWLASIGVTTLDQIEETGPVEIYLRLKELGLPATLNLLWALQGALLGLPWNELPPEMKAELLRAVARGRED